MTRMAPNCEWSERRQAAWAAPTSQQRASPSGQGKLQRVWSGGGYAGALPREKWRGKYYGNSMNKVLHEEYCISFPTFSLFGSNLVAMMSSKGLHLIPM